MGRGAELGRFADAPDLLGRQVAADRPQQLLQSRSASSAGQQSQERRRVIHGFRLQPSVSETELRCAEARLVVRVGGDGLRRRLRLAQHLGGHIAGGDLAQREHGRLEIVFPAATVASAPFAGRRARCAASSTSWNRLSTLGRQSSTVIRAMGIARLDWSAPHNRAHKRSGTIKETPAIRPAISRNRPDTSAGRQPRGGFAAKIVRRACQGVCGAREERCELGPPSCAGPQPLPSTMRLQVRAPPARKSSFTTT